MRQGRAAGCLLLAFALVFVLPKTGGGAMIDDGAFFGSVVLTSPVVSYLVVAILAFVLGTCVTLLCVHRRKREESPEEEEEQ